MSLEMVPEPRLDSLQPSCGLLAQRRVKSYEDAVGEPPDYDRNSITQFIWAPFSTKPNVDELRRTTSAAMATASLASAGRSHPTFSYNDTGSFEEVDEEKVQSILCGNKVVYLLKLFAFFSSRRLKF